MYKALKSFTTADYQIQLGQILEDDFDTQDVIQELLDTNYIEEYDSSLEITENGIYNVEDYETADVNVAGGGDEYNVKMGTVLSSINNSIASLIKEVPLLDISQLTSMTIFQGYRSLETIPLLDTTHITNMTNCFDRCFSLSDESLDNILQMCINATAYSKTKRLYSIGINSTNYPHEKIQALPHYQDFINAGWSF